MDLLDLLRRETLVAAVIPLDQIRPYLGALPISRQAAGLERALERACQNERKRPRSKPRTERPCLSPPLLGQGKVGRAGVPAAKTPFRFPVPRQHHRLGHRTVSAGPDVDVRGTPADLDVEAVGRRGVPGAFLLEVAADGGVEGTVDAQPTDAAAHRHA